MQSSPGANEWFLPVVEADRANDCLCTKMTNAMQLYISPYLLIANLPYCLYKRIKYEMQNGKFVALNLFLLTTLIKY